MPNFFFVANLMQILLQVSNPVPDLLPIRTKSQPKAVEEVTPTETNESEVADTHLSLPSDAIKTPVKKKVYETQQSSQPVDKRSLPTIQTDTHSVPLEPQCKRAPKRSVSPENGNGKVSKYTNVCDSVDCKIPAKDVIDSDVGRFHKTSASVLEFVSEDIHIKLEECVPCSMPTQPMKIESTEIVPPNLNENVNFIENQNIKVEYPIDVDVDIHDINLEHVTNKFNTSSIASDNLSTFCTTDEKMDSIYKIQNFEGVLQIQPNSLTSLQREQCELVSSMQIEEIDDIIGEVNVPCDDSSDSNAPLVDCSGENSADTAVEELEPTIQNLDPMEDDPIERFTDAENYVLESGEISADSGGIWRNNNKNSIFLRYCNSRPF